MFDWEERRFRIRGESLPAYAQRSAIQEAVWNSICSAVILSSLATDLVKAPTALVLHLQVQDSPVVVIEGDTGCGQLGQHFVGLVFVCAHQSLAAYKGLR